MPLTTMVDWSERTGPDSSLPFAVTLQSSHQGPVYSLALLMCVWPHDVSSVITTQAEVLKEYEYGLRYIVGPPYPQVPHLRI